MECGFTKQDVRDLARFWQLPVWDKPASPCLSSRIAFGLEVTPVRVRRIDAAERYLKERLELDELRVRNLKNDQASIEVPSPALPIFQISVLTAEVTSHLKTLGFREVTIDPEGFRSGRLNDVIPIEQLQKL